MGKSKDLATGETRFVNTAGDNMTGNLGIGTTSPNGALHVKGISDHGKIVVEHGGTSGSTNHNFISFHNHAGNTVAEIQSEENATNSSALLFKTGGTTTNMTVSHNGHVTMPNNPYFWVQAGSSSASDHSGGSVVFSTGLVNSSTLSDTGGHFNTSNGRFTAPVSGVYHFSAVVRIDSFGGTYSYLTLWDSGSVAFCRDLTSQTGTYNSQTVAASRYLSAGDYVYCLLVTAGDTSTTISSDSYFSGHLVG